MNSERKKEIEELEKTLARIMKNREEREFKKIPIEDKIWTSHGIDGKGPTKKTKLKDLSYVHIQNIIKDCDEGKLRVNSEYYNYFISLPKIPDDIIEAGGGRGKSN